MNKMNPSSDVHNKNVLCRIVREYWGLNEESTDRVCSAIWNPPVFDNGPELGIDQRLWVKHDSTIGQDPVYQQYRSMILSWDHLIYSTFKNQGLEDSCERGLKLDKLISFETYTSGIFEGQKLFKWLLKIGIDPSWIENITTRRSSNKELWWCLSKNPMDFLMMSTNQSFGSCMSLSSDYSGAMYLGMPQIWCDPWKYICFLGTGKTSRFTIKREEVKHFKYHTRSILIHCPDQTLGVVRWFPHLSVAPAELGGFTIDLDNKWQGILDKKMMESLSEIRFAFGSECCPYNDCTRSYKNYNHNSGPSSSCMSIRHSSGFEAWNGLNIRTETCAWCQEPIPYDDDNVSTEDGEVCESCWSEYGITCEDCDAAIHGDNAIYLSKHNRYICQSCYDNDYFRCDNCGDISHTDDHYSVDGDSWCQRCTENEATSCDRCGEYTDKGTDHITDIDEYWCQDCTSANASTCDCCKEQVFITNEVTVDKFGMTEEWCPNCLGSETLTCTVCGKEESVTNLGIVEDEAFNDQLACESCRATINDRISEIENIRI